MILRPMSCTLSSLPLLAFGAASQLVKHTQRLVVQPLCRPVSGCLSCPLPPPPHPPSPPLLHPHTPPQVVTASFFIIASFLVALTGFNCFHVKRVSRVTPRNVGVSTCGTGWLFNFSETFSFAEDNVKSVLPVSVVLSCSA